jgi:hypothetical protein
MSVSSLALTVAWRDYWGMWNPYAEALIAPIELSECHAPRLAILPQLQQQTFDASGKTQYNFHLVPGSLIFGLLVQAPDTPVAIQITDVGMGHQFFQEPISADQLQAERFLEIEGDMPNYLLLPTPHPVVGDGLFSYEAWGQVGTTFVMALGVAEVTDCPVR